MNSIHRSRGRSVLIPAIHFRLALSVAVALFSQTGSAAPRQWVGDTAFWSNPSNWNPPGAPQDGDDLVISSSGSGIQIHDMINDLVGLRIRRISICGTRWSLDGNELMLSGGIERLQVPTNFCDPGLLIKCGLRLMGDVSIDLGYGSLTMLDYVDLNGNNLGIAGCYEAHLIGPILGTGDVGVGVDAGDSIRFEGTAGNTFTGTLWISKKFVEDGPGEVVFDKETGLVVNGGLHIDEGTVCKLARSHQIDDGATVCLSAGAQFLLQGNTETIGALCITNFPGDTEPCLVDTGGTTLSVLTNIIAVNNSTNGVIATMKGKLGLPPGDHRIETRGSDDWALKIEAQVIGGGGFTKRGPSGLILAGDNSFTGGAVLQEGKVDVNHDRALGDTNGLTILAGAELDVREANITNEALVVLSGTEVTGLPGARLTAIGVSSWNGQIVLHTNLNVRGMTMTLAGQISGPGGIAFFGPGTGLGPKQMGGTEGNTYTGPTLVECPLLELNKPSGVAAFGGVLVVGTGGGSLKEVRWLGNYQKVGANVTILSDGLVNLNNSSDDFGPITFTGGTVSTGTGELGIYGLVTVTPFAGSATIDGRIGLPSGHHEFRVADGSALIDLGVNAVIVGPGHLHKTGLGQMWLNASNAYTGLTFVDEGSLAAFNAGALGASGNGTSVRDGASLILNAAGTTVPEPMAIGGAGDGSHGALDVFGDITLRTSFPAIYACLDLTTNATIRVEPGGTFTADGFISGVGPLTKTGPGTLVFANANTNSYAGDTVVREGTLELRKPNFAVSVPGDLVIGPAPFNSSATVRFFQNGGMTSGSNITVNAGSLLDLNGFGQSVTRLTLNDGGDAQTVGGVLSFPVGGWVGVGSLNPLGSHASSYLSGNLGLAANATLTFAVNAYAPAAPFDFKPELEMFAQVPAPAENPNFERAGIAKTGAGTMKLTANNAFNGRVDVLEGTLVAAGAGALGSSFDGTFVLNHSTLAIDGGLTVTGEILVLGSSAVPALDSRGGANTWAGAITLNSSATINVDESLNVSGAIGGSGAIMKIGAGTLTYSGAENNSYAGDTFVNGGILALQKPIAVTAIPNHVIVGNGTTGATLLQQSSFSIIGSVTVNADSLWSLNGQEEGFSSTAPPPISLHNGGRVQTGSNGFVYLPANGNIFVSPGAASSVISGHIGLDAGAHSIIVGAGLLPGGTPGLIVDALMSETGGSAGFQKLSGGTLRLTANNTYSGVTTIGAGAVQVDGSQPGSVSIHDGARLEGSGRIGAVNFANFSGTPGLVAPGHSPGILSCGVFNGGGDSGILRIELNGPAPGANGYDQLWIRGALTPVMLDNITLDASMNFPAAVNDTFTIIRKDGVRLVTGQFTGLPEGANFYISGEQFTITYTGGDGNDVVLTRIPTPARPALTIERVSPALVRLLWPIGDISDGFALQCTTNLTLADWTAATPLPVASGTNHVVTNAIAGTLKLYRLAGP